MRKISRYDDLPDEIKLLHEALPDHQKYMVNMVPWGMGAYAYCFTDEEKQGLEKILLNGRRKVPEEKILQFVWDLEGIASQKKYEILDTPKKVDVRTNRQEIIDNGKTFLKHIEGILSCHKEWVVYDNLESDEDDITHAIDDDDPLIDGRFTNPVTHIKIKVWGLANKLRPPMQEMITTLENYQQSENKKRGRKSVDDDNFTKLIKEAYLRHIGKPSTYPGDKTGKSGQFFHIIQYLFNSGYSGKIRRAKRSDARYPQGI